MTHQITIEQRLIEHKGNSIARDNLALAKIRTQQDEITRLRAENDALRDRLTLYDGQESTQDAPLGMTGVIADMAAEIKSLRAALTSSSMSELPRLGQEYDADQVACVKPLEFVSKYVGSDIKQAETILGKWLVWEIDDTGFVCGPKDYLGRSVAGGMNVAVQVAQKEFSDLLLSAITMRSEADVVDDCAKICDKLTDAEQEISNDHDAQLFSHAAKRIRALKRKAGQ